jgi:heptaprenyl diphosphate synthase
MTDPVEQSRHLIEEDLKRFEEELLRVLEPQKEYLTEAEFRLYKKGKKLRPIFLLLSARLAMQSAAELPQKVIKASVSLEMLHVATLIHDDIVDVAPTRRGMGTVFAERGTEMAVLIGDLQFIQAVRCFAEGINTQEDMNLIRLVLDVGYQICCGELDEIMTDPTWDTHSLEQRYFRTVDRKTAVLFGLACESGGSLVGAGKTATFCLSRFGRRFGRAFQIMDDIFDLLRPESLSGKAQGTDLAQGRLSLPIIYAMSDLPQDHVVRRIISRKPHDNGDLAEAIEAVVNSDGLFRSYARAREAIVEGLEFLMQFPPCIYRDALTDIANHIVDRGFLQEDH